ncbi:damage-control phosphatase ARMT1-like [Ptychodera flava]|uniref:damage-control phosphatase ARMT1-like n=1 Tax=Ptychodera flava TaxID=63121 RepID=UPI00396A28EB
MYISLAMVNSTRINFAVWLKTSGSVASHECDTSAPSNGRVILGSKVELERRVRQNLLECREMMANIEEFPEPLSAKYREQFAYPTIKDRLPTILTRVVDTVYQYKNKAFEEFGEDGPEDCKFIVSKLSELKNYMQTDKALKALEDDREDVEIWNEFIEKEKEKYGASFPSWFKSPWLLVECYMYRRINDIIRLSSNLKDYDPFGDQKRHAFIVSNEAEIILSEYLNGVTKDSKAATYEVFSEFVQIALWGNKCDLSISAGIENSQKVSPLAHLQQMKSKILVDGTPQLWQTLQDSRKDAKPVRVDIVLDNAGFELFGDLCFAEYLLRSSLADVIHMHYKAMPWFVSDVTLSDFIWTLQTMADDPSPVLSHLGKSWQRRLQDGSWVIKGDIFWTTHYDFSKMKSIAPKLYQDLSESALCFFKGDLNYRKLVGDLNWKHTTPYDVTLRGFHPSAQCSLRALKADLILGLKEGQAEAVEKEYSDWMISGNFAVIQFSGKVEK